MSSSCTAHRALARAPWHARFSGCRTSRGFTSGSTSSGARSTSAGWSTAHGSAEGFAWTEDAAIEPGPVGQRLAAGMRAAIAALAHTGNDVLVDDVFVDHGWLDEWRAELAGLEWLLVGVVAPLHMLEERERARGNRIAGEARAQVDVIHREIAYDLTVDTSQQSPEECARAILAAL